MRHAEPLQIGIALAAVTAALLWLVWPFLDAILWAVVIAILFRPVQAAMLRLWGGRANLATLTTLALVIATVVLPVGLFCSLALQELGSAYRQLSGPVDLARQLAGIRAHLPPPLTRLLELRVVSGGPPLEASLAAVIGDNLRSLIAYLLGMGRSALGAAVQIGVMLYVAYFLLRDGHAIRAALARHLPLPAPQRAILVSNFALVVQATIKGSLIVAAVQGVVGGTIFWLIGLHAPALAGAAMGFMSLIPAIGTGLIWLPVALFLLLSGAVAKGLALLLCGAFIISTVDNFVRPVLVGRDARLPDYLVLVTTLGGLELFGISGIVLGPVVASLFLALWRTAAIARVPAP